MRRGFCTLVLFYLVWHYEPLYHCTSMWTFMVTCTIRTMSTSIHIAAVVHSQVKKQH